MTRRDLGKRILTYAVVGGTCAREVLAAKSVVLPASVMFHIGKDGFAAKGKGVCTPFVIPKACTIADYRIECANPPQVFSHHGDLLVSVMSNGDRMLNPGYELKAGDVLNIDVISTGVDCWRDAFVTCALRYNNKNTSDGLFGSLEANQSRKARRTRRMEWERFVPLSDF